MNTAHFGRVILVLVVLLAGIVFLASSADAHSEPIPLEGQTFVHDPSTILKHGERYYLFSTGWGISIPTISRPTRIERNHQARDVSMASSNLCHQL